MPPNPKPTRMSDVLPSPTSSSTAPHTSVSAATGPLSSDGPTLPILSASQNANTNGGGKKRKRPTTTTATATASIAERVAATAGKKHTGATRASGRTNHEALYAPWTLLPPRERKAVEERGTASVKVVVWTRNQAVRAGVNRLKAVLCTAATPTATATENKEEEEDKEGDVLLAVSAQAEGTVKLVGIVDVGLRAVSGGQESGGEKGGQEGGREAKEGGRKWFVYTVLSSVVVPRGRKGSGDEVAGGEEGEGDAMDIDGEGEGEAAEDGGAVKEVGHIAQETRKIPVLTVWMSTRRIAGWREVFGEREVVVCADEE